MNKYIQTTEYKLIAAEKIVLLKNAESDFLKYGALICLFSWIWANIGAVKLKQKFWLFVPLFFIVFVAIKMSKIDEEIFAFKKNNGMWKGDFSLSFIATILIILLAVIVFVINFFALKNVLRNKHFDNSLD